uniref:Laccase I n=1 Tax=Neohortaea acidophila TaxID=245834 RepID=Q50H78_9PEZI|nr:laccase I [Neohortaea acidophila]
MAAHLLLGALMLGSALAISYHKPAWIPLGDSLSPRLGQDVTNGNGVLGTLDAPRLAKFLPDTHASRHRRKGYSPTDIGIGDVPVTGVTRYYNFTITEQNIAPDGVVRSGMVVNGGYPGPTIEANWGDYFEISVVNALPNEGTSIHWHGLIQHETPYMDGVPGIVQCPIAPGGNFTYRFRADLYGTSFYHSHYSAQYTGGIYGAMIIHGPTENAQYDEDIGPVLLNDWYHLPPPQSNNNLINGKMNVSRQRCTPNAGISKFTFQSGKTYRLRLINAGAEGMQKFSIDGHTMTVIANDFVPLKPYQTDVVTLGIGQRSDIIVTATGKAGQSYWMRSDLGLNALSNPAGCTNNDGVSPLALAAIYYEGADTNSVPTTNSTVPESSIQSCMNDPLNMTVPYYSLTPSTTPAMSQNIDITFASNGTNYLFYMNNSTFRADYNDPILLEAKLGQTVFPAEENVISTGNASSVRFVLYNYAFTGAHPMHMHGHNYWVLAEGYGTWDGTVTNAGNPQRRDVQLLPPAQVNADLVVTSPSYIVLQFNADNPGVWPLHCHIAWHVSAGLYVSILENPTAIKSMHIPKPAAWTGKDVPDQIDSGL